jgi:putative transposase/transposase-like zinc-binding protein
MAALASKRVGGGPPSHAELADIVRAYGAPYRSEHGLTAPQHKALRDIAQCRTAALGGHLEQCQACGASRPVYNSCRNRHCPKCQALAQAQWREAQHALLLPIPYFHLVFTLPHALTAVLRLNQRRLYNCLFHSVADTLTEFARDPQHLGAELGLTAVLHTWGQTLMPHVHLHCIVTGGGLSPDGTRWIAGKKRGFLFPVRALAKVFRGKFLARLAAAYRKGELVLHGACAALTSVVEWQQLLGKLRAKPWIVYAKAPLAGPEQVLNYLGRYTYRIAISNDRILDCRDGLVRFRYKDYAHGHAKKEMTLSATEFLRRFLLHVLPGGFMRVRHYGLLANRQKNKKLVRCQELLGDRPSAPLAPRSEESIPERIKRLTGVDITRCPVCGTGPMRIIERLAAVAPDTS